MKKIKELIQNRSSIQIVVLEDENRENWRGKQKTKTKIYSNCQIRKKIVQEKKVTFDYGSAGNNIAQSW